MEKINEFKVEVDTIDDWLDEFDARLVAVNIRDNAKKVNWCRAVIGSAGRGVLKNVDPNLTWDQVKAELRRYLGEEDNRAAAWRRLKYYKAADKSLGEIAADLLGHAKAAATEEDVQQRLAVDAFLEAIPWKVAREVKKKKPDTLKKALEEAKFLGVLDEEEQKKKKLELNTNMETQINKTEKQKRNYGENDRNQRMTCYNCGQEGHIAWRCPEKERRKKTECYACGDEGHIARYCPLWTEWRDRQRRERQRSSEEDRGNRRPPQQQRDRQRSPEDDRGARRPPRQLNW